MNKLKTCIAVMMTCLMALSLAACSGIKVPTDYDLDYSKYLKLGEYEGLTYTPQDRTVTDDDVQASIDSELEAAAESEEVTEGTVKDDSIVKVDYVGKIDGEEFTGGSAEDSEIDIPNSSYIDGFVEGMIGHNVGDTFDEDLQFPDDYGNTEVAGKPVTFTMTIKALIEKKIPTIEEYVTASDAYDSVDDYKASIREQLEENKTAQAEQMEMSEVFQKIVDSTEVVEYPEDLVNAEKEEMIETYKTYAEQYGMEYADFLEQQMQTTEEEFEEQAKTSAENSVKQLMIIHALAKELDISVSNKDYQKYLDGLLEDAGMSEDDFKDQAGMTLEEYAEGNNLYDYMIYDEVMEKIMELSKPTDESSSDDAADTGSEGSGDSDSGDAESN